MARQYDRLIPVDYPHMRNQPTTVHIADLAYDEFEQIYQFPSAEDAWRFVRDTETELLARVYPTPQPEVAHA